MPGHLLHGLRHGHSRPDFRHDAIGELGILEHQEMGGEDQGRALGKTLGDPLLELFELPGGRGHGAVKILLRAIGEIDRLQKTDVAPVENDRGSAGKTG